MNITVILAAALAGLTILAVLGYSAATSSVKANPDHLSHD